MVWVGACASEKTPLGFVGPGVKTTPGALQKPVWVFQQNSVPAHKSRKTQAWCETKPPIPASEWSVRFPNLNPLDARCGRRSSTRPVPVATEVST
ncbi:unnamed protein product [Haemonchus placei]|uniref:Transposase n=1 Tax=Haemonchus placei TaxID=6290 RepID=A0A0N4WIY5_HAEPC|nr:unnamed protein product [Haemonchus placei]